MQSFIAHARKNWGLVQALTYLFYFISHVLSLTSIPVFADEAIYIRWAQLNIDDWSRYAFFPLNDGKTPLFTWLLVPILKLFDDQLFAGRLLSVLVGLVQVSVMKELVKAFHGGRKAQLIGMVLTTVLPFWFFYHRMALMDGMMALFISLAVLLLMKLSQSIEKAKRSSFIQKESLQYLLLTGLSFGLSLLTKLPALFIAPIFVLFAVFPVVKFQMRTTIQKTVLIGVSGLIGLLLFLALKLHPAFGQLFLRSGNFTFTFKELLAGDWMNSLRNIPRFTGWLMFYLSPVVFLASFVGLLDKKISKSSLIMLLCSVIFCAPFVIFGRTVYPRYLLPVAVMATVSASLLFEQWLLSGKKFQQASGILLVLTLIYSFYNIAQSLFNVDAIPYVALDVEQYQTEWSAGYGVREASDFIKEQAQSGKVVVATEGYFGTLPDGILLYLHNQDVSNIEVFGIGEPIRSVPSEFVQKAMNAKFAYIMVNSHRMMTDDPRLKKIKSYPRPYEAPTFDIYQFTQ